MNNNNKRVSVCMSAPEWEEFEQLKSAYAESNSAICKRALRILLAEVKAKEKSNGKGGSDSK